MKKKSVSATQPEIWVLSADRRTVRITIPPVRLTGHAKPLHIHLDCDAKAVDEILDRLTALRNQMIRHQCGASTPQVMNDAPLRRPR